jgi:AraC-like DNA-binding protein
MESKNCKWIEYKPDKALVKYIDAYWTTSTDSLHTPGPKIIYPDGCSELVVNLGKNTLYLNGTGALKPGVIYLGGTLRGPVTFTSMPDSKFYGIRFKPGGFGTFFRMPLGEATGQFIELSLKELTFISNCEDPQVTTALANAFFLQRLSLKNDRVLAITEDLYLANGAISIDDLAKRHCIGFRSLERLFKNSVGVAPKELSKIFRFQSVLKRLKEKNFEDNFLRLAFEMGYYDQSHLTNEIKAFTGQTPSQLHSFLKLT